MDNNTVIWIVVAVVVAVLLIGLLAWAARKKKATRQAENARRANELRAEAEQHAAVIPDAKIRADEAHLEAEKLRLEAERAESRAQQEQQNLAHTEARFEDRVREADRLDPHGHLSADTTTDATAGGAETRTTDGGATAAEDATRRTGGEHRA